MLPTTSASGPRDRSTNRGQGETRNAELGFDAETSSLLQRHMARACGIGNFSGKQHHCDWRSHKHRPAYAPYTRSWSRVRYFRIRRSVVWMATRSRQKIRSTITRSARISRSLDPGKRSNTAWTDDPSTSLLAQRNVQRNLIGLPRAFEPLASVGLQAAISNSGSEISRVNAAPRRPAREGCRRKIPESKLQRKTRRQIAAQLSPRTVSPRVA